MNVVAIIQARMGSTRLPGKVLKPILGQPMLGIILERVLACSCFDQIVVATSTAEQDDAIVQFVQGKPLVGLVRGSESDVLSRFYRAAVLANAECIVRITSDNPFFHAPTACQLVKLIEQGADYACNNLKRTYPYGLDLEAFRFSVLSTTYQEAQTEFEREHVTPFIRKNSKRFNLQGIELKHDWSSIRLTVDTPDDYDHAVFLFDQFGPKVEFEEIVLWKYQELH